MKWLLGCSSDYSPRVSDDQRVRKLPRSQNPGLVSFKSITLVSRFLLIFLPVTLILFCVI